MLHNSVVDCTRAIILLPLGNVAISYIHKVQKIPYVPVKYVRTILYLEVKKAYDKLYHNNFAILGTDNSVFTDGRTYGWAGVQMGIRTK